MKRGFWLFFILCVSILSVHAQNKVVRYCEIDAQETGLSGTKFRTELIIGKIDSLSLPKNFNWKPVMEKVKTLTTIPDVLNYMASLGWSLIDVTAVLGKSHYYLKKEF